MTHKHEFIWGIKKARLDADNTKREKVIICIKCKKSLDDVIEGLRKKIVRR